MTILMTIFYDNFVWQFLMTIFLYLFSTCDIWDTDYNTDNWEPGFMTIFVTWQLIVTLDSIRNSCDVFRIRFLCPVQQGREVRHTQVFSNCFFFWQERTKQHCFLFCHRCKFDHESIRSALPLSQVSSFIFCTNWNNPVFLLFCTNFYLEKSCFCVCPFFSLCCSLFCSFQAFRNKCQLFSLVCQFARKGKWKERIHCEFFQFWNGTKPGFFCSSSLGKASKKKRGKSGQADRLGGGPPLQPDRFYFVKILTHFVLYKMAK